MERALADPCGVERLVGQRAAEEEQLPHLDSAGVGSRPGRDLDRGWAEGNASIDRAASADHRAGGQGLVGDEDVVAGRAVERAGQGGAANGQASFCDDQNLSADSTGADDRKVERDPIGEAAARVLGFDVHGVGGRAAAGVTPDGL